MITLRPPFRAQNMEGLYNKVIKGQFNKIPDRFSNELYEIVKLLIQVHTDARPSCDEILKNPIIQKRIEYFKSFTGEQENEDKALLQTIRIPKNLLFLSDKLPKPNYVKHMKNINNLEDKFNMKNYRSYSKKSDFEIKDIKEGSKVQGVKITTKETNNSINSLLPPVKSGEAKLSNNYNNNNNYNKEIKINPQVLVHSGSQKIMINDNNKKYLQRYSPNGIDSNNRPKRVLHKNISSDFPSLNNDSQKNSV